MGNLGAEQSMSPEVNSGVTHRCFVIMPFGNKDEYDGGAEEARFVYNEIIAPAVKIALGDEALLHCEMTSVGTGAITTSIIRQIAEADVCIVDITGANANVFFELGMRYALCKRRLYL